MHDPRATLAEAGLDVSATVEIAVVEDSAEKRHLVLPPKPADGEISEDALVGVAAGNCSGSSSCCC